MSASRKLIRYGTRAGLAGGVVYFTYNLGLWKSADETIVNYEKFKKDVASTYNRLPPSVTHFVEDKAHAAKQKTIDPVTESASSFKNKWLNFDYSWTESEDGIIKPAWNKGVAVFCDFVAHLPENTVEWTLKGWKYASDFVKDSSSISGKSVANAEVAVSTESSSSSSTTNGQHQH